MIRASACAADVLLPGGPGDGAHDHRGFGTGLRRADARDRCRALREKDLLLELVRLRLRRCFEPMCCVRPRICAADIDLHLIRALDVRSKEVHAM